jgi:hypothetical protein
MASKRNGANQATTFARVQIPHAAPATAARPVDGALMRRMDAHAARVVIRRRVGSCSTKTTRVTRSGFTARKSAEPTAHGKDGTISRKNSSAATAPKAWTIDWNRVADRGEELPVAANQPPNRPENSGERVGEHEHKGGQESNQE